MNAKGATYIAKAIPEFFKELGIFMQSQDNNPFYQVFHRCLIITESSMKNSVKSSMQKILRKQK